MSLLWANEKEACADLSGDSLMCIHFQHRSTVHTLMNWLDWLSAVLLPRPRQKTHIHVWNITFSNVCRTLTQLCSTFQHPTEFLYNFVEPCGNCYLVPWTTFQTLGTMWHLSGSRGALWNTMQPNGTPSIPVEADEFPTERFGALGFLLRLHGTF